MSILTSDPPRGRVASFGTLALLLPILSAVAAEIPFSGDAAALQRAIDDAPEKATILCERTSTLVVFETIMIRKAITLKGLTARLPAKLGRMPMMIVEAEGVTLADLELHGNYESVSQKDRAPMIWIQKGGFTVERCTFYDSTKDGVMVTPLADAGDIVGGVIRDIASFRMGRDAVSISGGNEGQKVRDLTVENVSLKVGYERGAVEISDGTDHITVRNVSAADAVYAIDVQDHGGKSAANTNIVIEDVEAVNCRHIVRTANSPRDHAGLILRRFAGHHCERPIQISHTRNVAIEGLELTFKAGSKSSPIHFKNCQEIRAGKIVIRGLPEGVNAVLQERCEDVKIEAATPAEPDKTEPE